MFASVLGGDASRQQRWGTGVVLSALFHASVLTAAILYAPEPETLVVEVKPDLGPILVPVPGPRGRLGDLAAAAATPMTKPKPRPSSEPTIRKNDGRTTETPPEMQVQVDEPVDPATIRAAIGSVGTKIGVPGVPWGTADGDPNSQGTGPVGTGEQVFDLGGNLEPPRLLSGEMPQYTRDAIAARVEGTLIAQCIVTSEGTLQACRIVKSVPHMDAEVMRALRTQRYSPGRLEGRPVSVRYTLRFNLKLPGR